MKTVFQLITPEGASDILRKNTINRKVRKSRVEYFKKIISDGNWQNTHQGICISEDGVLLDGQHRLLAIAACGLNVWVNVTTGAPLESFNVIDDVCPRSITDRVRDEKRIVEMVRLANSIRQMNNLQMTPFEYSVWKKTKFYEMSHQLIKHAGTATANVTISPMRIAVVARALLSSASQEYAFSQYRALSLSEFDEMSTRTKSFAKRLAIGKVPVDPRSKQNYSFAMGYSLYDLSSRDLKMYLPDEQKVRSNLQIGKALFEEQFNTALSENE